MSSREAFRSVQRARASTTGMKTTTTGVLLMKAESGRVKPASTTSARNSLAPARRKKIRARASIAPVRSSAALRTNMQPIVIGALLLKTLSVSSALRVPLSKSTPSALKATRSGESHSRTKARKTPATRAKTRMR